MNIETRYASATSSSSLGVDPRTYMSDSDVIGAYGLAGKINPLSTALSRLLSGDNRESTEVVEILAEETWKKARGMKVKCDRFKAEDIAKACLAWWRDGTCKTCGGHGKSLIPGTLTLSDQDCKACHGTGKIAFERTFPKELRELANWAQAHMERCMSVAGPIAMGKIAPKLEI